MTTTRVIAILAVVAAAGMLTVARMSQPAPPPTAASTPAPARTLAPTVPATGLVIWGVVTDAATGQPIDHACITVGPPIRCTTTTDRNGKYVVDLGADGALPGLRWQVYALRTTPEPKYAISDTGVFPVRGVVQKDFRLQQEYLRDPFPRRGPR